MAAPLTGRKVFLIAASAFAVIIGVNIVLAVSAVRTFPGLEVANSYVASQEFNTRLRAQQALGWTIEADEENGEVTLSITDRSGAPVEVADLTAIVGRATTKRDDVTPDFVFDGTLYRAPLMLHPGNWNVHMTAHAKDGTEFIQRVILHVKE